ncbi:MAG TPA: hypothetical protein PK369_04325 [Thermoclostridium sp.]|nr:hypothetical protein [Thermoclostridium sp.]HPU45439.1 hypothetical protein [Thermoclostridium sp.]
MIHSNQSPATRTGFIVATYAVSHFLVDFSCAYLMFSRIRFSEQWFLWMLIYNFLAFAMQMPIGLMADRFNRNAVCAAAGCVLVALAYPVSGMPMAAVLALGIGNALFHIGGGIDVLNISRGKSGPLGIFVSPGAFGIYFGTILGNRGAPGVPSVAVLLVTAAVILFLQYIWKRSFISGNLTLSLEGAGSPEALLILGCLFVVVILRSYVGLVLSFPWKGEGYWGLALICAVVLGKAVGGILADMAGAVRASILSLGFSAAAFLFSNDPLWGVLAVFLFNMTMPITLWAAARMIPGAKGFAFGLLTFALFLGFIPVYLGADELLSTPSGFAAASLVSLVLLLVGLKKVVKA